jgi:hypothetical protein
MLADRLNDSKSQNCEQVTDLSICKYQAGEIKRKRCQLWFVSFSSSPLHELPASGGTCKTHFFAVSREVLARSESLRIQRLGSEILSKLFSSEWLTSFGTFKGSSA